MPLKARRRTRHARASASANGERRANGGQTSAWRLRSAARIARRPTARENRAQ
ncbi:hypothetical protein BPC006_I3253 [Burkholderia pseudomallei BPC006]|nr:hypothetical protein BPC006_I3253 [Burkholderia pseudomallei BPC006]